MNYITTQSKWYKNLKHEYIKQDSDVLVVMLPGYGYNCDKPLFYYLTGISMELGFDVVKVTYGFSRSNITIENGDYALIREEIIDVLKEVDEYKRIIVVGKSLGTLFLQDAVKAVKGDLCKMIYFTPTTHTLPDELTEKMLMVYGEDDPYLSDESRERIKNSPANSIVAEHAKHNLQTGDIIDSLDTMMKVMRMIKLYMVC